MVSMIRPSVFANWHLGKSDSYLQQRLWDLFLIIILQRMTPWSLRKTFLSSKTGMRLEENVQPKETTIPQARGVLWLTVKKQPALSLIKLKGMLITFWSFSKFLLIFSLFLSFYFKIVDKFLELLVKNLSELNMSKCPPKYLVHVDMCVEWNEWMNHWIKIGYVTH